MTTKSFHGTRTSGVVSNLAIACICPRSVGTFARPVLHVDDDEVEACLGEDLGGNRRAGLQPGADDALAGLELPLEPVVKNFVRSQHRGPLSDSRLSP